MPSDFIIIKYYCKKRAFSTISNMKCEHKEIQMDLFLVFNKTQVWVPNYHIVHTNNTNSVALGFNVIILFNSF